FRNSTGRQIMLSIRTKQVYRLGFMIALVAALAVFVPAAFTQAPQDPQDVSSDTNKVETPAEKTGTPAEAHTQIQTESDKSVQISESVDLDHLEKHMGQEVTL